MTFSLLLKRPSYKTAQAETQLDLEAGFKVFFFCTDSCWLDVAFQDGVQDDN